MYYFYLNITADGCHKSLDVICHYYMRNEQAKAITELSCIWLVAGLNFYRYKVIQFRVFVVFASFFRQTKSNTNSDHEHFQMIYPYRPSRDRSTPCTASYWQCLNGLQSSRCNHIIHIQNNIKIKSKELYSDIITVKHIVTVGGGYTVAQLVAALPHQPESRGFDTRWGYWDFSLT